MHWVPLAPAAPLAHEKGPSRGLSGHMR